MRKVYILAVALLTLMVIFGDVALARVGSGGPL
jgi:hypothetical protein